MTSLAQIQAIERERLQRLSHSLDKRAHDMETLFQVLVAARDFAGLDPVPHIKAAVRHYVEDEPAADAGAHASLVQRLRDLLATVDDTPTPTGEPAESVHLGQQQVADELRAILAAAASAEERPR